jgi:DNA-directed RNA polymerase
VDLEIAKTEKRFSKQQERLENDFGWGVTDGPIAVTRNFIKELADRVPEFLIANNQNEHDFIELIKDLPKETIALCCLQTAFSIIGHQRKSLAKTLTALGQALEGECYAKGLMDFDKKLSKRLDRLARTRHGNLKYRRAAVRSIARKNKFVVEAWDRRQQAIGGNWCLNLLLTVLPDVFSLLAVNERGEKELGITESAFNLAEQAIKQAIHGKPVYLPSLRAPKPWTDFNEGGSWDNRFRRYCHIMRTRHTDTAAMVRGAIAEGTMKPTIDALNTIQSVGWRINKRILEVIKWCHTNSVAVPSLPRAKDLELPSRSKEWDAMTKDEQKAWKIRANQSKLRNRGFSAERVLLAEDLATAELLSREGVFFTPCNIDWRGRVYPLPHFNFQREDRVRALFEFSHGEPITESGLFWLKVHVANTGDFDKISKKSFGERVAWVDDNITVIQNCATIPTKETFWVKADKPFMFLSACMELVDAIKNPQHITHLPVSVDGSCSGLQHLSAMTQATEGALVNLTHSASPLDIYSIVAERVLYNIAHLHEKNPAISETEKKLCKLCLDFGITRSLVKRNVMTYGYSSQKFGMASQLVEDLMQPLALEVLAGERPHHPFGDDNGFIASRFLASEIFSSIEEVVKKPAEAMSFLRSMAKALAHENKPVEWITPTGIPWINRYHESNVQRVVLWLNDRGVTIRHTVGIGNGWNKRINKTKSANSIAPNFVHALDAAHLMMTVNTLKEEGIENVALVHDSFGVHCTNSVVLGQILRQEFVRLYTEFDPLNDILASNLDRVDNPSRLPRPVPKGPLDINEVKKAEYAFS